MSSYANIHLKYLRFLSNPKAQQVNFQSQKQLKFLLTYLGAKFISGYRIQQILNPTIILISQMHFNPHPKLNKIDSEHKLYQIICLQSNDLSERPEQRQILYNRVKQIIEFLEQQVDIQIVYLNNFKLSTITQSELETNRAPIVRKFYKNKLTIKRNNAYRNSDGIRQGGKFHRLIQVLIKGSGKIQNQNYINNIFKQYRINYIPDYVIWTASYIIGREVILNGYFSITSQKWMRKSSVKRFKRYDLTLRNQEQVCIIDWKFSRMTASQIIAKPKCKLTNKTYYELANMQYKVNDVKLIYVSFDQKHQQNYHKFTQERYQHLKQQIQILGSQDQSSQNLSSQIRKQEQHTNLKPIKIGENRNLQQEKQVFQVSKTTAINNNKNQTKERKNNEEYQIPKKIDIIFIDIDTEIVEID